MPATTSERSEDMFGQAIRAWESAVEAGVKMQEEYAKGLRQMCCESGSLDEWYNKSQSAVSQGIIKTKEGVDEAIRLINQHAESSLRLIQKALDSQASEPTPDARAKFVEWWQDALETARNNTQAVLQANSRVLATWSELAKQFSGEAAEGMATVARKTAEQAEKMSKYASEQVKEMARQASENGK